MKKLSIHCCSDVAKTFCVFIDILVCFSLLFAAGPIWAGCSPEEALARLARSQGRVRIGVGAPSGPINVSSEDGIVLTDGVTGKQKAISGGEITVSIDRNHVAVNSVGESFTVSQELILERQGNSYLKLRNRLYPGRIIVAPASRSNQIVNELPLEQYLVGVLAAEIGDAPLEALKAQAVVARSEVIHKLGLGRHKDDGFELCASEHCMAYKGISEVSSAMMEAVEATRGLVLVAGGQVLDAVFHNVCGGITAGAEDVWDSEPIAGLQPVWDVAQPSRLPGFGREEELRRFLEIPPTSCFCNPQNGRIPSYAQKYFRWRHELNQGELKRRLGAEALDIKVIERRASGRVRKLFIETTSGSRVVEKELPIRKLFDLPSGLFVVDLVRKGAKLEKVVFSGGGSGHGVGLCQMGAWSMAEKGYAYSDILNHYYPRARLMQLYR